MFSSDRERETLAQCEAELTRDETHHFRECCRRMKFRYGDIADHCRHNLKG